jgi:hypothetical protein
MRTILKKGFCSRNELEFMFNNFTKTTKQPFFKVYSSQIEVLKEPIDFYIYLHVSYQFLERNQIK